MKKSFNLTYVDTKEQIVNLLNQAGLPIVAMQSIINEIKSIVDANAVDIIGREKEIYLKEQEKKNTK